MTKVSCLIPAYNEHDRIANVLSVVSAHPLIDEVIVIDDGSSDGTSDVVRDFPKVNLIVQKNQGKSAAICHGIDRAQGDFLLFLDADLIGLDEQCLSDLIKPVISGEADLSISLRRNSPWFWRAIGLDFISGERVFSRALIKDHILDILALPGFGLEVFFNSLIIRNNCRVKVVVWNRVDSPYKSTKYQGGKWAGIKGDIGMLRDIFRVVSLPTVVWQIWKLRRLRVR